MSNFEADDLFVIAATDSLEIPWDECKLDIGQKIFVPDPAKSFFKNVMSYMDRAIREDLINAICFFKKKFGIDFGNETREIQPTWSICGATLSAFSWPCDIPIELILTNNGQNHGMVNDGGWMVRITEPGFIGIYNEEPHYYPPNTYFFFGFHQIVLPNDEIHIFNYRSTEPLFFNSSAQSSKACINFHICNLSTRRWGQALGTIFINSQCSRSLIEYRLVINFHENSNRGCTV